MTCGPRAQDSSRDDVEELVSDRDWQFTRIIGPRAPWHAFAYWVQSWGV